ncbi:MAG TPA: excinuclease ABC subunit UvrA [Acidiferrobacteraceae bacterium]|nr:excinuclease ABC subunit UvrA [Acidiferrobacteraceae bacterium]HEX19369.1 excinuclease ABC subunit UvrA [Acidiferrobacteraceae bacterium]
MDQIRIRGARTHNLKNIDVDLPRNQFIVITGLSGSGKSSLAFDTLYAEGQRRYVESLSSYARQFLSLMEKPDVDLIEGLSPAISIEQKSTSHNPRSTVGTVTEIYDYLRLLYARVGEPRCPEHDITLEAQIVSQMVDHAMELPAETRVMLLAPLVSDRKGEHVHVLDNLRAQGFVRARIDGKVVTLDEVPPLKKTHKHSIEAVVDRLVIREGQQQRLAESFETALNLSDGLALVVTLDQDKEHLFSSRYACPHCGYSLQELEPRLFSFNNPAGACPDCDGLGVSQYFDPEHIVTDPTLALPAGAIKGWDRRNQFYFQMLESLAQHYKFDIEKPFEELSQKVQDVILYGSGDKDVTFTYIGDRGQYQRTHPFEGVIPNIKRRYHDSESNAVREELAKFINTRQCETCGGSRLRIEAQHVFVAQKPLHALTALPIGELYEFCTKLELTGKRGEIANKIIKEVSNRLGFLVNVGLNYLSLARSAETLSGGEAQRIRLASQIGAGLVGVLYVLDEPSIGLHQRDNARLLGTLKHLRDLGNTVIVVEHDEEAILSADHVLDIGPGAGVHGGEVVAEGKPEDILQHPDSITGQFLSGRQSIAIPRKRTPCNKDKQLQILGASGNNLKDIHASIPVGLLTCITGVSGSGKSTLINDTLYAAAAKFLYKSNTSPAPHQEIIGLDHFDKVVDIDQSPIGRTPRSNPATYTGLFTPIRELFTATPEARERGYTPGRFSFNVRGGRCEACQGDGLIKVEMHFLPDIYVSCDVCQGKRYNRETLEIRYKGKNIYEVLNMTVEDGLEFFHAVPVIKRKLDTMMDVGLSYITLGQSATTLSGGEAQRIKLSRELSKRDTGRTLYILDEPTTGLHFYDINHLLEVLHRLRDHGNTIVVIEHNLDVIKTADWIIDLGPEGGDGGGTIVVADTPENVADCKDSHTGRFLKPVLEVRKGEKLETKEKVTA